MAYNFEEQEQLDDIKAFWRKNGNFILTVVTVIALAVAGWRLWGWYQSNESQKAATAYDILQEATQAKDLSRVRIASESIFDNHSGTIHAPMAALMAARAQFDGGDNAAARKSLQWAIDNAADTEFALEARLRLAAVMLDDDEAQKALVILDMPVSDAFKSAFADRRGDLLEASGQKDEAITAYTAALAELNGNGALRRLIQLKLDALKGAS